MVQFARGNQNQLTLRELQLTKSAFAGTDKTGQSTTHVPLTRLRLCVHVPTHVSFTQVSLVVSTLPSSWLSSAVRQRVQR